MNKLKITIIAAALAAFAAACGQTAAPTANAPKNDNKAASASPAPTAAAPTPVDEAALGLKLYTTNCMTCHRDSGKGGKTTVDGKEIDPDDITTAKQKAKPDEKIYGYIADGFPDDGMPAFKDKLKPEEIKAIVKHVRTLQQ